jgi:hypothetical protein
MQASPRQTPSANGLSGARSAWPAGHPIRDVPLRSPALEQAGLEGQPARRLQVVSTTVSIARAGRRRQTTNSFAVAVDGAGAVRPPLMIWAAGSGGHHRDCHFIMLARLLQRAGRTVVLILVVHFIRHGTS